MRTARALEIDFRRATAVHLSDQTVRNRLHEHGMRARRPARCPILTVEHRTARLNFACEHQNWQLRHWRPVLFTDESRFSVSTNDRRARVWRRHADCNIVEVDPYGGGSVMVWAGLSLDGRTDLYVFARGGITAARYRDEILVRPYAGAIGETFILMQDNARSHTARLCMAFLEDEGIAVMDWPARSPDLNRSPGRQSAGRQSAGHRSTGRRSTGHRSTGHGSVRPAAPSQRASSRPTASHTQSVGPCKRLLRLLANSS